MKPTTLFAHAVQDTALGHAIRSADPRVIEGAQLFHVFGLTLVLASALLLNLRLFGRVLGDVAPQRLAGALAPLWLTGLVATVLSGITLFLSAALVYDANKVFWTKLLLLLLAAGVQALLWRRVRDPRPLSAAAARSVATLSLLLWASVGIAGRAIGFI